MSENHQVLNTSDKSNKKIPILEFVSFEGILFYKDGLAIDTNEAMLKLTGSHRNEIISSSFPASHIPNKNHRSLFKKATVNSMAPFEIELLCNDGRQIPVEIESQKVTYNKEVLIVVAVRDISNRKRVEDEITKLSVAVDQSANIIVITKTDGQIEYVNRSFTKVTGYSPEEAIGQNPRILKSGIQPQSFYKNLWQTLRKGQQWKGEFQNRKKNGELYWESAIITPVKNKDGDVVRYIAIKEDITKQKKAEQSLRESEEQYRSMVSNIPGVIYRCVLDSKRTIHYITDAIETLTGYKADEFLLNKTRSYASVIHPDDRKRVLNTIQSEISNKKQYTIEYRIVASDNSVKWVSDNGRPVYDESQQVKWLDGFIFDISERVIALEELKKAKMLAEEANKAKSEFLANISHEIRTPLNTVLGFAELLESMTLDVTQLKYLNSIKSSGKNLMTLINDLLDLSKIEAGKVNLQYGSCNVKKMLDEIRDIFFQRANQKGVEYIELIDKDFPAEILFDETRLRQILINLVGNAIKFTHEGHVDLVIKARSRKTQGNISTMKLEIKIADTGIGIPAESYQVIFDSFRQYSQLDSRKYEGTGLGLAITKHLVEAMDGKIFLESEVGIGTTFKIVFPRVEFIQKRIIQKEIEPGRKKYSIVSSISMADENQSTDVKTDDHKAAKTISQAEFEMLLDKMEHRLYRRWKHFESKKPLKEIKSFAQELIKLGKNNKLRFISEYGEQLYLTIENFDIEEMQLKLEQYPNLLRKVKKMSHGS